KTRNKGYLRLSIDKEGIPVQFPALAREIGVELDKGVVTRVQAQLDPISVKNLLRFPESLEAAGWRPLADNAQDLAAACKRSIEKPGRKLPAVFQWAKADGILALKLEHCDEVARWSMSAKSHTAS